MSSNLLDEANFDSDNIDIQIGCRLRNKKEAVAVQKLARVLSDTIDKIGVEQKDEAYINSPLWQEVVQAAKEAYDVLMIDEDLDELIRQEKERK